MSEQAAQDWARKNKVALRRLILTVEANSQSLELLIAVCDDRNLQARMIEQYEAEFWEKGIEPFRVRLNPKDPSLRRSVAALVDTEPGLRSGEPAVVTVLNAEALLGVTLGEEKSEQERFFFSLQWQREALRRFEFAVVLWVPDSIATRIGQQAPDFWSWRGGVFEFGGQEKAGAVERTQLRSIVSGERRDRQGEQSIEGLLLQVEELEENKPDSALLITLYNDLGETYEGQYAYGEAVVWYEKALFLAKKKNSFAGQARALRNVGDSLRFSGRPTDSIQYYEQGLEIVRKVGDLRGEASFLNKLGNAYYSLGQYQKAIDFQQQSLGIKREIGDFRGEAYSLGNLGNAYRSLGQYQKAIDFQQQQLGISRKIDDHNSEANSLCNLGSAYRLLGQYQKAIDFQQQALTISRKIGDRNNEANSLGNLGSAYRSLGQYQKAIDFQQQQLEIEREIGDRRGEASSQFNIGLACSKLKQKEVARTAFTEARQLYAALGFSEMVERCDRELNSLEELK
ncbi:MAG: tetratricopeptide repeat protein [Cyanobacteria bacterium P01_D01_bin.36]